MEADSNTIASGPSLTASVTGTIRSPGSVQRERQTRPSAARIMDPNEDGARAESGAHASGKRLQ